MFLPRSAGPPLDGGFDRTQTGGVLNELQSGAHCIGIACVAAHVERNDRAEAFELASCGLVSGMARRAWIAASFSVIARSGRHEERAGVCEARGIVCSTVGGKQ